MTVRQTPPQRSILLVALVPALAVAAVWGVDVVVMYGSPPALDNFAMVFLISELVISALVWAYRRVPFLGPEREPLVAFILPAVALAVVYLLLIAFACHTAIPLPVLSGQCS